MTCLSCLRRRRAVWLSGERGAVTAETALALPALLLTAGLLIAGIAWAASFVRCQDAAGALARAVARGEDAVAVEALASVTLPSGTTHRVEQADGVVVVTVSSVSGRGPLAGLLPEVASIVKVPVEP